MRACPKCHKVQEDGQFYPSGRPSHCRTCESKRQKKKKINQSAAAKQKRVIAKFKCSFGIIITSEQIAQMETEQNYRCPLCERAFTELARQYCIDHDHDTLEIRGLLCRTCNSAIGFIEKSGAILDNINNYLERG